MRFGILGPVAAWTEAGEPVVVSGVKVRALLADLLVHAGRPVSADRLIDDIWSEAPPGNAPGTLSAKASQLRRALDDAEPGARRLVVSPPPGYRLDVAKSDVDALRFVELTAAADAAADPARKAALLSEALDLWRGAAFADFADEAFTQASITKLEEQRLVASEDLAQARLALGHHSQLVGDLTDLVTRHPLRERLRGAHMQALYGSGRQSDALDSFEHHRNALADELGLDPGAELVALQRAILAQDPALSPTVPAAVRHVRPSNLPAPLTDLIGRDAALVDLADILDTQRLVTLTGPGGVGKTRLAVAAAHTKSPADGAWLIELAGVERDSSTDLADVVAQTLGIRDAGEQTDPIARLGAALHDQNVLVVLDNCEHLIDAAAELADSLLSAAAGVRIIATSREPLGLVGEYVFGVMPLERDSAVALFAMRASASARGFTLDDDTSGPVTVLCKRLDGIPLALELAATRVRALGVHEMVARLDDRFRLLATGYRGAPPRQQTLTAMIDWSWELLESDEQAVLRRLAVHADGATLAAAEIVCSGADIDPDAVPDLLVRLVDRSLVTVVHTGSEPRYRLLESIAAYCVPRLLEADEEAATRTRHHDYHLEFAEEARPHLYGGEQKRWLRRLDAESANLRATFDDAVASGDGVSALRLTYALGWYWFLRGRLAEGRRAFAAALAIGTDDALRGQVLAWDAGFGFVSGVGADRDTLRDSALQLIADPIAKARAQWFLAYTALDLGDVEAVEVLLDQALTTFAATDDRWGIAAVHIVKAKIAHLGSDIDALRNSSELSAELFTASGDRWGKLQATGWLGGHAELVGDHDRAAALHTEGLQIAEELELWPEVSGHLSWLGWIAMQRSEFGQAAEYCEQALKLATEQGSIAGQVFALMGLGFSTRKSGDLDRAEQTLQTIVDLSPPDPENGPPLYLPNILCELGFVAELRGDADTAWRFHVDAYRMSVDFAAPRDVAYALEGLAGAASLAGDHTAAAHLLGAADAHRATVGLPTAPTEQVDLDRVMARLTDDRDRSQVDALIEAGRTLARDEVAAIVEGGCNTRV
ncbi:BTAD domain-containing putative transcriptional regulator [Antrihabitans sp. NCIMB 15449]|uniref:BTAD domain-containing putative transcriptional regulator n=1 Tax=Antrihabitans spumae TaxID=3373370 RepID=A0ABW7JVN0_9NOCA